MKGRRTRAAALVAALGVGAATAAFVPATAVTPDNAGIRVVGPLSPEHGFPTYYEDANGTKLEPCLDGDDPLCNFAGEWTGVADFPDFVGDTEYNFPGELFYMASDAIIEAGAFNAQLVVALEGAFSSGEVPIPGDQIVFGRVRVRIDGLQPDTDYTVTHPYGEDLLRTDEEGNINSTVDIGVADQDFTAVKRSKIGPFLEWADTPGGPATGFTPEGAAEPTHIGDPAVEHAVTGSPYSTNFFRVSGPGVPQGLTAENQCGAAPVADCMQTSLFSLWGKYAVNSGVSPDGAYYQESYNADGTVRSRWVDVFATSDDGQEISAEVAGVAASGPVTRRYRMEGEGASYVARIVLGANDNVPESVTVKNGSDVPVAVTSVAVTDDVDVTRATYSRTADGTGTLTVRATSSLKGATLKVDGYADAVLTDGVAMVTGLRAVPHEVTVRSEPLGGTDTTHVELLGTASRAIAPEIVLNAPASAQPGQQVVLDASRTLGTGDPAAWTYTWTETGALGLLGGTVQRTPQVTFTMPADGEPGAASTLSLRVRDASGLVSTVTHTITLEMLEPATAVVAAPTSAAVGSRVTLDGSGSLRATTWSWSQAAGAAAPAELAGEGTSTLSFTMPATPVTFTLTVDNLSATPSSQTVTVTPIRDALTVDTAEYRRDKDQLRIGGTNTVFTGNTVTVLLTNQANGASGTVTAVPDAADGGWSYRGGIPTALRNATQLRYEVTSVAGGGPLTGTVQMR